MQTSHLKALQKKYEQLEQKIHEESVHAARNDFMIEDLKKRRLYLREEIERAQKSASG